MPEIVIYKELKNRNLFLIVLETRDSMMQTMVGFGCLARAVLCFQDWHLVAATSTGEECCVFTSWNK
jgi:hypothetical protein